MMTQPPLDMNDEGAEPAAHRYIPDSSDAGDDGGEPDRFDALDEPPQPPTHPSPTPMGAQGRAALAASGIAGVSCIVGSMAANGAIYLITAVASLAALILFLRNRRGTTAEAEKKARQYVKSYRFEHVPSKRAVRVLNEVEEMYFETHEHPITMLPWVLAAIVATAAAVWIGIVAGDFRGVAIFWALLMIYIVFKVWMWQREAFIVTDQYIHMTSGIVEDNAPRMNIAAVTDAKKHVPWHSKFLFACGLIKAMYGTFTLETAGQDQPINKAKWLPCIDELNLVISALSRGTPPYPDFHGPETTFPY